MPTRGYWCAALVWVVCGALGCTRREEPKAPARQELEGVVPREPIGGGSESDRYSGVPLPTTKRIEYSSYPEQSFPNQVYFGDTHLHTSYSTDAGMIGNTLGQ